jgi:hypothetical protein
MNCAFQVSIYNLSLFFKKYKKVDKLNEKFNQAMWNIYYTAKKKCKYNATLFMRMLSEYGGVKTAQMLL